VLVVIGYAWVSCRDADADRRQEAGSLSNFAVSSVRRKAADLGVLLYKS